MFSHDLMTHVHAPLPSAFLMVYSIRTNSKPIARTTPSNMFGVDPQGTQSLDTSAEPGPILKIPSMLHQHFAILPAAL